MRRFGIIAAVLAAAVLLSGCESVQIFRQTWEAAKSIVVNKKAVIVAVQSFNAAEASATAYIRQKHCPPGIQKPTCMSPPIREQLVIAMTAGRPARDALLDFVEAHPNEIGDQGLYDALKAATASLKNIFAVYKIGGAS